MATKVRGAARVCFHNKRRCGFCGIPRPATRVPRRCPACGRFLLAKAALAECQRCQERGFVALHLF